MRQKRNTRQQRLQLLSIRVIVIVLVIDAVDCGLVFGFFTGVVVDVAVGFVLGLIPSISLSG